MKRLLLLLAVLGALGACNKPSEENCRKAIANMRTLLGTDSAVSNTDNEGDIRRCVGGSNKKSVECAINAKTLDELYGCNFIKRPTGAGTATGSAPAGGSATPGSATDGSAAPGSAAPGSAADPTGGSAAPGSAAPGSAAGSAAPGSADSAAPGSAAGSSAPGSAAPGSAAPTGSGG